jgi:hypothetical protein
VRRDGGQTGNVLAIVQRCGLHSGVVRGSSQILRPIRNPGVRSIIDKDTEISQSANLNRSHQQEQDDWS